MAELKLTSLGARVYGTLKFDADNTYDIGATSSTLRPRDLFLGRNAAIGGIITTGGAATTGASAGDIVLLDGRALRAAIGGSARNLIGVDANSIIQLGDSGNYAVALPRFTGVAAGVNNKGIIFVDTGTAGQLVFFDGVTGARYKLTGTAF